MFVLLLATMDLNGGTVAQWVYNALLAVGLYWLGRNERARCRRDDEQAATLRKLETKLEAAGNDGKALTEKLVEERLRAASHEVNNHVQAFAVGLEVLKQNMQAAATEFKELNDADHENELSLAVQIQNLKVWMLEAFASKADLRQVDEHVRTLENKVAGLPARARG